MIEKISWMRSLMKRISNANKIQRNINKQKHYQHKEKYMGQWNQGKSENLDEKSKEADQRHKKLFFLKD
jgi:hypothetical protein